MEAESVPPHLVSGANERATQMKRKKERAFFFLTIINKGHYSIKWQPLIWVMIQLLASLAIRATHYYFIGSFHVILFSCCSGFVCVRSDRIGSDFIGEF